VVYILEGEGSLRTDEGEQALETGSVVYTAPGSLHGFSNTGLGALRFLCLVPEKGDAYSPED
jgi:quercetin dioxygenase-like cupin family protein